MLKPLLNEKVVRARQKAAEKTRTALHGVPEIDHFILRKSLRDHVNEDEAILKSVVTLAIADDEKKHELGYTTTSACSLCGDSKGGFEHLMASCTALSHVRTKCPFASLLPHLPAQVLRGIPPAMSIEGTGPFWHEEETSWLATSLWCDLRKIRPTPKTRQFIHLLPDADKKLNARQIMHKHRSDFALLDWELPPLATETAPEEPNVFNDGSLKNSLCQWWSAGGIGVWWPNRNLTQNPLNANEQNLLIRSSDKKLW